MRFLDEFFLTRHDKHRFCRLRVLYLFRIARVNKINTMSRTSIKEFDCYLIDIDDWEYWLEKNKRRENLLYRVYVYEKSTDLTWSDQVSNSELSKPRHTWRSTWCAKKRALWLNWKLRFSSKRCSRRFWRLFD